ncbi:LAETG motif-containing sortase-dependent surface protein [Streptomyces roseifaciens]
MTTELRGLPREIVAGSGWHAFTYRAANTSGRVIASLSASMELWSWDRKNLENETTKHITVQWYNSGSRRWEPMPADYGYFAETRNLKPRAFAEASLRLKVDAKAPAGFGGAFQTGFFSDRSRTCGYSAGAYYYFDVLAAGSKPTTGEDSKGTTSRPGKAVTTVVDKPAPKGGLSDLPATGELATTGTSSSTPLLLGVAGAAVVVGGAAVAVARRGRGSR